MGLCQQSDASAFQYAVWVGHSFSSKEQVSYNFMTSVTIFSDLGAQENKVCHCFHCFPIYLPWSERTRCHDLCSLNVEILATFSLSSFTFIKRLFSSSSFSALRVVLSVYLRLLIFPLASRFQPELHSAWHLAWCTLYKLSKQDDNIQSWCIPFPILNQSIVPCLLLTVASWSAYKFFRRQITWSGISIS